MRVIERLVRELREGRLIVLPTETQYALAGDAANRDVVELIRRLKRRSPRLPFSVFLPGLAALPRWRIRCPAAARRLAAAFWPGPLTLILPHDNPVFAALGGRRSCVGVRVSPEPLIIALATRLGRPLVATSANPSGAVLTAQEQNHWLTQLARGGQIAWVRPPRYVRRQASTVIDCCGRAPRQLRAGPIASARWHNVLHGDASVQKAA